MVPTQKRRDDGGKGLRAGEGVGEEEYHMNRHAHPLRTLDSSDNVDCPLTLLA